MVNGRFALRSRRGYSESRNVQHEFETRFRLDNKGTIQAPSGVAPAGGKKMYAFVIDNTDKHEMDGCFAQSLVLDL